MAAIVSAMGHSASLPMGRSASLLLALLPQLADAASTTCGGGWYLANYINHELGTVPRYDSVNYGGTQPTSIPYGGELVSCPETCAGLGYGPATGARWACNYFGNDPDTDIPQWDAEGCVPAYAVGYENAPDGTDFPAETPGGANAHCSVMAYDIDGDGTSEIVKCVNSLTVEFTDAASYTGYPTSANGYSGYQGSWQTANMADLGWDFYHAFALECTVKDCTHASIHECVTGGNGCRDWLSGLAIQCYCEPVAENCPPLPPTSPPPPSPPPPPPTPATPPPFCGGKWYLGNYANHVVGQPADYKNTDYSGYVNCKETCDIIGGEATGARFACNTGTAWGCGGAWIGAQEDGYDYPSGGPGGHNTHCMTMVYDVDHDGNPDVVSCTNVGTIKYVSNANWAGYSAQNAGNLDWQYKAVSELDWEFSHRFNEACVVKDCTHNDILTCVMANPNTGRAIGAGCNDWLNGNSYGLAIQCYCSGSAGDAEGCPARPSPPPPPPPPAPYCGGGWYLGNYANHVVGTPADYKNTDYSGYVNCKETCDIIGGEATGARFACNTGTAWGCGGAWIGAQEDGYDYPSGGPGGHNTHCMTMVYDVDHDGNPDVVSCTNVGTIKYVSNANWAGYSAQNAGNLDWQYKAVSELDWEFSHRFNEACVVKDCTHNDILTCVMANPNTGRAIGAGCNDWLNGNSYGLAIQCYCTKECNPPPPPEYVCDELAPNGARCGVDGNGTVCKYCCGATGYCGDGDLWCGDGADFIYSYKLRDPERSSCPRTPTRVEFEQYCTVNPATNNQLCVRLPAGKDFDDPMVVRRLEEVFARDTAAANPTPEPTPTPEASPSPSPSPEAEVRRRAADAGAADAGAAPTLVENVEVALAEDWRPSDAD